MVINNYILASLLLRNLLQTESLAHITFRFVSVGNVSRNATSTRRWKGGLVFGTNVIRSPLLSPLFRALTTESLRAPVHLYPLPCLAHGESFSDVSPSHSTYIVHTVYKCVIFYLWHLYYPRTVYTSVDKPSRLVGRHRYNSE